MQLNTESKQSTIPAGVLPSRSAFQQPPIRDQETERDLNVDWAEEFLKRSDLSSLKQFPGKLAVVGHVRTEFVPFIRTLTQAIEVACVIPKPKSIMPWALQQTQKIVTVEHLVREDFFEGGKGVDCLAERIGEAPVILLDIGGYFCPALDRLRQRLNLQGII